MEHLMPFAANFDRHMKRALEKSVPELTWKIGWHLRGLGWRVDLAGLKQERPRVLIEAELKKDDPAANVIKIWSWARTQKNTKPILFVQGFSKLYVKRKKRLQDRANFVGERMAEAGLRIDYQSTEIKYRNKNGAWVHYNPKTAPGFSAKEGAGRLRQAAQGLAHKVARLVRQQRKTRQSE
jgi:hypothetical protein